eukprot:g27310.t1
MSPLLQYCVQFRSTCYRNGIIKLDGAQKRFTRMLLGMEDLIYKERLDRLGLFSLECRKLRGDLIEVYKVMRGMDKVNDKSIFPMVGEFKNMGHIFK